jgi:RNA polymerase sigma-70 factor (ECF subfamily)
MARPAAQADDTADDPVHGTAGPLATPPGAAPASAWSERSQELAQLLGRAGLGDRRAFAELYDKTSGYLFGVVLRIQRDRAVAEELLQEIYVALWRSAAGFDAARSQPLTWLGSIARNRAIDSLRRAQTQPMLLSATRGGDDEDDDGPDAIDREADAGPGLLELLDRACQARELTRCIEGLSAAQRQSVALAFYDGLSHAEVAEQLRQPLGTVKSWLRRGLLALRDCLDAALERDAVAAKG